MQFKPKYFCPLALLGLGLWGGTGWAHAAQAATPTTQVGTKQPDKEAVTMHQGTAPVTLDADGNLTIGAGTLTKGDGWCWQKYVDNVTNVVVEPGAKIVGEATEMFANLSHVNELNLRDLDVSQATSLARLFAHTDAGEIDVTGWQTGQVTDLAQAFSHHSNWGIKGLENWDTSQVTSLAETFYYYRTRQGMSLDVKNWNTSRVTNMVRTFMGILDVPDIRLDNWDARQVTRCEEFARFEELSEWLPRSFTFGPNMRFDGANGVPALSDSRGWTHRWRHVDPARSWGELKMPWDSGQTYSAKELQQLYTGKNTPNQVQTYYLDSLIPKISGHDGKVYDGRPAALNQAKYQLASLDLPPEVAFELEEGDLAFADGETPTEPGTYRVTLSPAGVERLLYHYDEDDYPGAEVNILLSQKYCGTYTITAKEAPAAVTGKVQVHHKSTTGKTLDHETLTGEVGSPYEAKIRQFDQHQFSRVEGSAQGKFGEAEQTVTYWYTPDDGTTGGQPAPGKPEPGQPAPDKPAPGKPAPGEPEPGKPEPGKPEPGKPEPGKPAPSKPAPGKPEPGQPAPEQLVPDKPAPGKPTPGHETQPDQNHRPNHDMPDQLKPQQPSTPTGPQLELGNGRPQGTLQLPGTAEAFHGDDLERPTATVTVLAGQPVPTTPAAVTLPGGLTGAITPAQPTSQSTASQNLPQTGERADQWWRLLGAVVLAGTLYLGRRWKVFSKK
ncbi:BspA family leucine-rich repeat surface protein [Levilactobacillus acidifarinae]|nr:BspA family leucine-rich repeat surface protein [Levilactobacillus acidifarinae]GEO70006.1 hypothetical protein LAC03_19160 [Levilactobacillus acidifarinae]